MIAQNPDSRADPLEMARRERLVAINAVSHSRESLAALYGQVWDSQEVERDFEVLGFLAPYCVVRRKSDGVVGSLEFQHEPRIFFRFEPDR